MRLALLQAGSMAGAVLTSWNKTSNPVLGPRLHRSRGKVNQAVAKRKRRKIHGGCAGSASGHALTIKRLSDNVAAISANAALSGP